MTQAPRPPDNYIPGPDNYPWRTPQHTAWYHLTRIGAGPGAHYRPVDDGETAARLLASGQWPEGTRFCNLGDRLMTSGDEHWAPTAIHELWAEMGILSPSGELFGRYTAAAHKGDVPEGEGDGETPYNGPLDPGETVWGTSFQAVMRPGIMPLEQLAGSLLPYSNTMLEDGRILIYDLLSDGIAAPPYLSGTQTYLPEGMHGGVLVPQAVTDQFSNRHGAFLVGQDGQSGAGIHNPDGTTDWTGASPFAINDQRWCVSLDGVLSVKVEQPDDAQGDPQPPAWQHWNLQDLLFQDEQDPDYTIQSIYAMSLTEPLFLARVLKHGKNGAADKEMVVKVKTEEAPPLFLDAQNQPYDLEKEALGVSNWITTKGLPLTATWGSTSEDPKNFRLQARLPAGVDEILVKLEVKRKFKTVFSHEYVLNLKGGDMARGRFLRLVADKKDDAASGIDEFSDPESQTILVQLGDVLEASYKMFGAKTSRRIFVGRPSVENYDGDNFKLHDIRKPVVRATSFFYPPSPGPGEVWTPDQHLAAKQAAREAAESDLAREIEILEAMFAQVGIRPEVLSTKVEIVADEWSISNNGYSAIPHPPFSLFEDELKLASFLDKNIRTVDLFFLPLLYDHNQQTLRGITYGAWDMGESAPAHFKNFILVGPFAYRGTTTASHEFMHLFLNDGHRQNESIYSLFHPTEPGVTKAGLVYGNKRIGPFPEVAGHAANGDTAVVRRNAAYYELKP